MLITLLSACSTRLNDEQTIPDHEWRDILINTIPFIEHEHETPIINYPFKSQFIFKYYNNVELKSIISKVYAFNTALGYEVDDSILLYIKSRNNKPITNNLDTMLSLSFIYDTNMFDKDFLIYSEPFYINENIICVSLTHRQKMKNITRSKVYFIRKESELIELVEFYDVNENQFYSIDIY